MIKLSTFTNVQSRMRTNPGARHFLTIGIMAMTVVCLMSGATFGQDNLEANDPADRSGRGGFCSQTASLLLLSCGKEAEDDLFKAQAICLNVSNKTERAQCFADATVARNKAYPLCNAQRFARLQACRTLGEGRYDPNFDPALFDTDFTHLTKPNPYVPLTIGNKWEYAGADESSVLEVLNETKLIEGVTCIVLSDVVSKDGDLAEDTDDWLCQAKNGDVYYFGEEAKDFESFDGDKPRLPELVKIDGSFKHGRDGDKGGIFFLGSPTPGKVYRQEFSVSNAEDIAKVVSTTYKYGSNPTLDKFVPQKLAQLLCSSGDCVVTKEYSPREPGSFEYKYYARGIGSFLATKPSTGKATQLVNCNFDKRCASLPKP